MAFELILRPKTATFEFLAKTSFRILSHHIDEYKSDDYIQFDYAVNSQVYSAITFKNKIVSVNNGKLPFDATTGVDDIGTFIKLSSTNVNRVFCLSENYFSSGRNQTVDDIFDQHVTLIDYGVVSSYVGGAYYDTLNNIRLNSLQSPPVYLTNAGEFWQPYSDSVSTDAKLSFVDYPTNIDRYIKDNNARNLICYYTFQIGDGIIRPFGYSRSTIPTVEKWDVGNVVMSDDGKSGSLTYSIKPTPDLIDPELKVSIQWSLDGISYQPYSTSFSGLTPYATYNAYAKDQYGGIRTFSFTATPNVQSRKVDPFFKIENCNSIKYYEINDKKPFFDNASNCDQQLFNITYHRYYQPFLNTDIITTQIKSTYRNISINVKNTDGEVVLSPSAKLINQYTEQIDRRDCTYVRDATGAKTLIYFNGGSLYEPDTYNVIGSYAGLSTLPSFCYVGMYVELVGNGLSGNYKVSDIVFNDTQKKWCLSIDYALPSQSISGICQSTYNLEHWNVYEFDFITASLSGTYTIEITATDNAPFYNPVKWVSDLIIVKSKIKKHYEITATHSEPINQIDYSTGIEHLIRIPISSPYSYDSKGDSELFTADDGKIVIQKDIKTRIIKFTTSFVPQYVVEKLVYYSGHNGLKINGYDCVKIEDCEIKSFIENGANVYQVTMQLQLDESLVIADATGVVSESASVLGSTTDTVIAI